jgi:hypothetical protein
VGYWPSASNSGGGVAILAFGHASNCFHLASPLPPYQHGYPRQEPKLQLALPSGSLRHASPPTSSR